MVKLSDFFPLEGLALRVIEGLFCPNITVMFSYMLIQLTFVYVFLLDL